MEFIIGAGVSLAVQWLKKALGTNVLGTYIVVFALSLFAASVYVYIQDTALWPILVQVLTVAGAFYAFVLSRFEDQ
jgi:hypothetical protein